MSDLQWMSLTLCLVGVIPVGNFSINDTFFSLICPYAETPASLKTPSPSQGFQILRQQTTSIHNWYFYNAHSGHFKCLHSWFPTANKTKTCKQKATGQRELKLPVISPGLLNSRAPQILHLTRSEEKVPTCIFQLVVC